MDEKISVITTVFNEEKNLKEFIDSVINQTKKPDEFVIVDGRSKDKTYELLKEYSKKYKWIKNYQKKGNIAEGRNYAIQKSTGEIIFTADSSTRFEKNWIKKIMGGFKKGGDVVFGKYFSKPKTLIEKFLISRLPNWDKINPDTFLPSNRHTAFRKKVWEKVGKFPEHIKRADDNWLHEKAHKMGFKYIFVKDAEVCWLFDRNFKSMLKLAFLDSKSEGFTSLWKKRSIYYLEILVLIGIIEALLLGFLVDFRFITYPLVIGMLICILILWPWLFRKTKDKNISFIGVFLTILLYFAHVFGVLAGIIQKRYAKKE